MLPARQERTGRNTDALDLSPLTPPALGSLAQLAALQGSLVELLSEQLPLAPSPGNRADLAQVVASATDRHRQITRLLAESAGAALLEEHVGRVTAMHARTQGVDFYEQLAKAHLVYGLLDDFYLRLAVGLPGGRGAGGNLRAEVERLLGENPLGDFAESALLAGMAADASLASRLALFGRRVMGDALLEIRAALDDRKLAGVAAEAVLDVEQLREVKLAAYSRLEPLISELFAGHSLRMDALGLTA